jgi:isoquinoline 1-oxidoreductase beta subunit
MEWRSDPQTKPRVSPTRRQLLIGGGIGTSLVVGFLAWPRRYVPNLVAATGEHIFNAFLKIGSDGHIVVVVPQVEFGQAATTLLPQIVADELGADWRSVGVEPAPINPLYANTAFGERYHWERSLQYIDAAPHQITDEGLTLRAFAEPLRHAAATARELLCLAAANQWHVASAACETANGYVLNGKRRARFADLVAVAAHLTPPDPIVLRQGDANRLIGTSLPRLDAPAKCDGSANYAADIRIPGIVFATLHRGPIGTTKLAHFNEPAARKIAGAIDIVELPLALACVGATSWAASQMLAAAAPQFLTQGAGVDDAGIKRAIASAFSGPATQAQSTGDVETALAAGHAETATYSIGLLPHAALEPLAATARYEHGQLEIWTSAHSPELASDRAAAATGLNAGQVVIHSVMGGGSFGRRFELEIVEQVAILACKLKRPVQLFWSRGEDMMQERLGGGVSARLTAQVLPDGRINAWRTSLAAPPTAEELRATLVGGLSADRATASARGGRVDALIDNAQPPYVIPNFALEAHSLDMGMPTGPIRGRDDIATCFFNESFINELSAKSGVEPFSFRMALIDNNTRLAQCLAKASALAGWSGGAQGTNQGIACYTNGSASIAVIAEATVDQAHKIRVTKLTAVADLGQLVNPDISRQQIEGGLLFGLGLATANPIHIVSSIPRPIRLGELGLPQLTDTPEMTIELIPSSAPASDAWDVGVPPVAPAIAAALFSGSGQRYRTLPLSLESK